MGVTLGVFEIRGVRECVQIQFLAKGSFLCNTNESLLTQIMSNMGIIVGNVLMRGELTNRGLLATRSDTKTHPGSDLI